MGPITYSLCQKPIIGVVMFVSSLCSFPALIFKEPLSLAGSDNKFTVPVDKPYSLDVDILAKRDSQCQPQSGQENQKGRLDFQYSLLVEITRKSDHVVILKQKFDSSFMVPSVQEIQQFNHESWSYGDIVTKVDLTSGEYIANVKAVGPLEQNKCFGGYKITELTYSLVAGHGK